VAAHSKKKNQETKERPEGVYAENGNERAINLGMVEKARGLKPSRKRSSIAMKKEKPGDALAHRKPIPEQLYGPAWEGELMRNLSGGGGRKKKGVKEVDGRRF